MLNVLQIALMWKVEKRFFAFYCMQAILIKVVIAAKRKPTHILHGFIWK